MRIIPKFLQLPSTGNSTLVREGAKNMHDTSSPPGWNQPASDEHAGYLYKEYKTHDLSASMALADKAAASIHAAGQDTWSQLAITNHMVAVTLNYPATSEPTDVHFRLAGTIDALYSKP